MNPDEVKALLPICLSAYAGGECHGCHRTLDTLEELSAAVWWPWEKGRVGHAECFNKAMDAHSATAARVLSENRSEYS